MIEYSKLYHLNRSKKEVIKALSPLEHEKNIELFTRVSGNLNEFKQRLRNKSIFIVEEKCEVLEDSIKNIRGEIKAIIDNNSEVDKTKLDFKIAISVHRYLRIPKRAMVDYDFWVALNLFYFIDVIKWRWEKNPEDPSNWFSNAKAIFSHALGVDATFKNNKFNYGQRNNRLQIYKYWWLAEILSDHSDYSFIEKVSDKVIGYNISTTELINQLEGSKLLSVNNKLAKSFSKEILLSSRRYKDLEIKNFFKKYNAYSNLLFENFSEDEFIEEIFGN